MFFEPVFANFSSVQPPEGLNITPKQDCDPISDSLKRSLSSASDHVFLSTPDRDIGQLIYLEEPLILRPEDVKDFTVPICVEIKPLQISTVAIEGGGTYNFGAAQCASLAARTAPDDDLKLEADQHHSEATPFREGNHTNSGKHYMTEGAIMANMDMDEPRTDTERSVAYANKSPSVIRFGEQGGSPRTLTGAKITGKMTINVQTMSVVAPLSSSAPTGITAQEDIYLASSTLTDLRRPAKHRREYLDAVELPTLSPVPTKHETVFKYEKEESEMTLKCPKKPDSKVKRHEGLAFSVDTVRSRLKPIGLDLFPISLEKGMINFAVPQDMISNCYGWNQRSTFPSSSTDDTRPHRLNDFMFPNPLYNPQVPEVPGAPGLWYTIKETSGIKPANLGQESEYRVITRRKPGIWQYKGQYVLAPADPLTKDEWATQHPTVQNAWANNIHAREWGRPMRARIALRARLQRAPRNAELDAAIKAENFEDVLPAQISRALLLGEETVYVWTMKCVRYDTEFQLALIEQSKTLVSQNRLTSKASHKTNENEENENNS